MRKFIKFVSIFLLMSIVFFIIGLSIFIMIYEIKESKGLLPDGLEIRGVGRVSTDIVLFDSGCGAAIFNLDENSLKEINSNGTDYLKKLINTKNNKYSYKAFERIQKKNFSDGVYGLHCASFFIPPTVRDIHNEILSEQGYVAGINGFPAYLLILPKLKVTVLVFYTT